MSLIWANCHLRKTFCCLCLELFDIDGLGQKHIAWIIWASGQWTEKCKWNITFHKWALAAVHLRDVGMFLKNHLICFHIYASLELFAQPCMQERACWCQINSFPPRKVPNEFNFISSILKLSAWEKIKVKSVFCDNITDVTPWLEKQQIKRKLVLVFKVSYVDFR